MPDELLRTILSRADEQLAIAIEINTALHEMIERSRLLIAQSRATIQRSDELIRKITIDIFGDG